jgi:hypothetical protein
LTALLPVVVAIIGGPFWLANSNSRVSELQDQIKQLRLLPFEQACADFARKMADEDTAGEYINETQTQSAMRDMGCRPPAKNSN